MSQPSPASQQRWPAPAKLNLGLYVVGKRPDGYHLLETLFQLLDFGDELSFTLNRTGRIERAYDYGFPVEQDLCLRAAKLLQQTCGTQEGANIQLHKRLPMGGGLGGGSSDAATVLVALNHLWNTGLSTAELADLGLRLGADVPLFVHGHSAWGSGIGEQLQALELPELDWLVIYPEVNVSTAQIFSHKRLTAQPQMKKIRALKMALGNKAVDSAQFCTEFLAQAENQLEPLVRADYPEVEAIFAWFAQQQPKRLLAEPKMSGSGGAVFAPLASQAEGAELLAQLPPGLHGFVAKSSNRSPLLQRVAAAKGS